MFAAFWLAGVALTFWDARRTAPKKVAELERSVGVEAGPTVVTWLRRQRQQQALWIGTGVLTGSVAASYANTHLNEDYLWMSVSMVTLITAGGITGHLVAGFRMQPLIDGPIRSATLSPRRLADYLTPRELRAVVLAPALVAVALVLAALTQVTSGMTDGRLSAAVSAVALALILAGVGVLRFLVGRPRAAATRRDLLWQEHMFAEQIRLLPRSLALQASVAVVAAAVIILTQAPPTWFQVLAWLAVAATAVTWFNLLPDDRDPEPKVLQELRATT